MVNDVAERLTGVHNTLLGKAHDLADQRGVGAVGIEFLENVPHFLLVNGHVAKELAEHVETEAVDRASVSGLPIDAKIDQLGLNFLGNLLVVGEDCGGSAHANDCTQDGCGLATACD